MSQNKVVEAPSLTDDLSMLKERNQALEKKISKHCSKTDDPPLPAIIDCIVKMLSVLLASVMT